MLNFLVIYSYNPVTGDVLYKEPLKLLDKTGHKVSFSRDIAMNVQKAT